MGHRDGYRGHSIARSSAGAPRPGARGMTPNATLMFQIGVIMLIAFVGAALASRFRLSVVIGYIVAGMVIGPNAVLSVAGFGYQGLVTDSDLIRDMSQIGLILLLFFVGLEFSIRKLQRVKEAAIVLAALNLGVNMFAGFVIGTWLGWPLIDTIFLAGVVSMSSSALTAKALIDLNRLDRTETEFLLGMVVLESFLAMYLLTLVNSLVISADSAPTSVPILFLGVGLFIGFFAFLAAVVIPRVSFVFERIESDELFILFALGIVFLSAAVAELVRIPAIIGAFFIGMAFADTNLVDRLERKMEPLRDVFVAVFFIAFGMMIDPGHLPMVLPIVAFAIPLIFLNDMFLTGVLAYFLGFNGKASISIGASLIGRNEEAILYASVGTRSIQASPNLPNGYGGTLLQPFAGVLCIAMSGMAPIFMHRSERIASWFSRRMPRWAVFGGDLVRRTLKTFVMKTYVPRFRKSRVIAPAMIVYSAFVINLVALTGYQHWVLSLFTPIVLWFVWAAFRIAFREPVRHTNYGVDSSPAAKAQIETLVLLVCVGALATVALVAVLWQLYWPITLGVLYGYFLVVVWGMRSVHAQLVLGKGRRFHPLRFDELRPVKATWFPARSSNGRR